MPARVILKCMDKGIEMKIAEVLQQKPYEVKIGDKTYVFNRLSLKNRENISVFAAMLPDMNIDIDELDNQLPLAVEYGKYSAVLAKIIVEAANLSTRWFIFKKLRLWWKKRQLFRAIVNEPLSFYELYSVYQHISQQIAPSFFLSIFISLKEMNHLKPTKETDRTAPI